MLARVQYAPISGAYFNCTSIPIFRARERVADMRVEPLVKPRGAARSGPAWPDHAGPLVVPQRDKPRSPMSGTTAR